MDRALVVGALAQIARKPAAEIADHLLLASLGVGSSLGLSLLRSRLETASGKSLEPLSGTMRVGDLVTLLANGAGPPAIAQPTVGSPAAAPEGAPQSGSPLWRSEFGLGLDIQDVDSLPATSDYRSHEFYQSHFSASEIATALLRPDARLHLCGIFCAKEAGKKSHPLLLETRMSAFAVTHEASGKPLLTLNDDERRLPYCFQFMVSISHTTKFAAAACITTWSERRAPEAPRRLAPS